MAQSIGDLAAKGVPQPLVTALYQYQTAIDSGLPEASARLVFQDNFLEAKSPIQQHTDDMIWIVRGHKGSSLQTSVSLIRRGSTDAATLMEEAQKESEELNGSYAASPSSSFAGTLGEECSSPPPRQNSMMDGGDTLAESESGSQRLLRMLSEVSPIAKRRRPLTVFWPETLALNLVTQWCFSLTVAVTKVCTVNGRQEMVAVRREVHRVFGQPTRSTFSSDKDGRGAQGDILDYPNIYFNVENFDQDAFHDIQLSAGYNLAVLLTAGDQTDSGATLFRGVLSYETIMARVLKKAHENKSVPTDERKEFIPLLGPERKGKAEIAVAVSNADLQMSSQFRGSDQTTNTGSSNSGLFSSILRKTRSDRSPSPSTLRGDEILQCCLTFVSIPIQHVCHILSSSERATARQWLYIPASRDELDRLLEQHAVVQKGATTQEGSPGSPSASPMESSTSSGGGSFFASLKKRFA